MLFSDNHMGYVFHDPFTQIKMHHQTFRNDVYDRPEPMFRGVRVGEAALSVKEILSQPVLLGGRTDRFWAMIDYCHEKG